MICQRLSHPCPVRTPRNTRECFNQRKVGLADTVMVETLTVRDPDVVGWQGCQKDVRERTLAYPRLTGHEHHLTLASAGLGKRMCKRAKFAHTPNQLPGVLRVLQRRVGPARFDDWNRRHHQSIAAPMSRFDVTRAASVVAERPPQFLNT